MEKNIRTACKVLSINDGCLLVTKKENEQGVFYVLPGGGQKWGETLIETLKRECIEEIGLEPSEIGKIVFIREGFNYIDQTNNGNLCHRIDFIFECKVDKSKVKNGTEIDKGHKENVWIEIEKIEKYNILPKELVPFIKNYSNGIHPEQIAIGNIQ
jgi:8-oxo-dGTP diphosphatase